LGPNQYWHAGAKPIESADSHGGAGTRHAILESDWAGPRFPQQSINRLGAGEPDDRHGAHRRQPGRKRKPRPIPARRWQWRHGKTRGTKQQGLADAPRHFEASTIGIEAHGPGWIWQPPAPDGLLFREGRRWAFRARLDASAPVDRSSARKRLSARAGHFSASCASRAPRRSRLRIIGLCALQQRSPPRVLKVAPDEMTRAFTASRSRSWHPRKPNGRGAVHREPVPFMLRPRL